MRTFQLTVSNGLVGCKVTRQFEVEDDATDQDIEEAGRDAMFEVIEWNYNEIDPTTGKPVRS